MDNMMMLNEMRVILNKFFDDLEPGYDDIRSIKGFMDRVGVKIVWLGLAIIAERLQRIAKNSMLIYMRNEREGDQFLIMEGIKCITGFWDVIDYFDFKGITTLLQALNGTDEDVRNLASLSLSSEKFSSKVDSSVIQLLKTLNNETIGTSCKMSLAYTMHMFKEPNYFKKYISPFFLSDFGYKEIFSIMKKTTKLKDDAIHNVIVSEIFYPGSSKFFKDRIVELSLIEVIMLDIATDGKAFQNREYSWQRKVYK